jgi:uncharacterized protein
MEAPPPPTPPLPPEEVPQPPPAALAAPQIIHFTQDEKTLGIIMHVLSLAGLALIGPLIIWLIKKDSSAYVDAQGRELLNFQISYFIYAAACVPLIYLCVGVPMLFALCIAAVVLTIIGVVKAAEGKIYRFPLTLRLL